MTHTRLADKALDQLFRHAHTHYHWLPEREIPDEILQELHHLAFLGPTSANSEPMRIVFIKSPKAKECLKPHLDPGNVQKTMTAPVTADLIQTTAFRNGSLEGAYLLLAARALGLDCGPMSGFNNEGVDQEFLAGTTWRSNFLLNLGYGDESKSYPRQPRLSFEEACKII